MNLSLNSINFFYEDQFSDLVSVMNLDLSHNSIELLFSGMFSNMKLLKSLDLHSNPMKTITNLVGLDWISIYLDTDLLISNEKNFQNFKNSLRVNLYKTTLGIKYTSSQLMLSLLIEM